MRNYIDRHIHLHCDGTSCTFEMAYQEEKLESGDTKMGATQRSGRPMLSPLTLAACYLMSFGSSTDDILCSAL